MAFETIIASGQRSALPHGRATTTLLPAEGFVTLDFGIIREGYCSDMTRTVCLGKPKPEERNAYEAVLEAQQSAVLAVAAGVSCGDVTSPPTFLSTSCTLSPPTPTPVALVTAPLTV